MDSIQLLSQKKQKNQAGLVHDPQKIPGEQICLTQIVDRTGH